MKKVNKHNKGSNPFLTMVIISGVLSFIIMKLNEPSVYRQQPYNDYSHNIERFNTSQYTYTKSDEEPKPKTKRNIITYEIPDRDLNPNYRLDNYIRDYLEENPDIIEDYLDE